MNDLVFSTLSITHWRQFSDVSLRLSDGVTILTGRNGTGKTTVLNILGQHSAFSQSFVGSPIQARDSQGRYTSGVWDSDNLTEASDSIGSIGYSNGETSSIVVPRNVGVGFSPTITPKLSVAVLYVPSHRRTPAYKKVTTIPTEPITRETALTSYQTEFWNGILGETTRTTPLTKMKEAIVSMAAFGLGNDILAANQESYALFVDFQERLRQIVPKNIGFRRIIVQVPDVIIETDSGRFLIDASSGGLMSLIDLAWQITLFGRGRGRFAVVIDEPENHLHPSMQREILPALVRAFPQAQFVIATHSPFIVTSIKAATVYAFDLDEEERASTAIAEDLSSRHNSVVSVLVNLADRTSASEVLRQVLGVPITVPIWAEQELDELLNDFKEGDFDAADLRKLQASLKERGLDEFLPDVLARAYEKRIAKAD